MTSVPGRSQYPGKESFQMDALQLAHATMVAYEEKADKREINYATGTWLTEAAQAYAAIAQAEQLKRIADALQWKNNLLYREFRLFEATEESEEQDDYGEELRAEKKQAQEFLEGTRRGLGLEE